MNKQDVGAGVVSAQIDRLVSGDLPEPDRRSLLAWLDEEPARWRACALAFLEAQAWEQATGREGEAPAEPWVQGSGFRAPEGRSNAGIAWAQWLAIAGLILVAFGAGAASAWSWLPVPEPVPQFAQPQPLAPLRPSGPLLATVSVRTNLDPRLQAKLALPVDPDTVSSEPAASISEYERKQWERRGYDLIEETRYLPAKMPDGRSVMVPVTKVRMKYKGTPVS
jgi:hypothetical protein